MQLIRKVISFLIEIRQVVSEARASARASFPASPGRVWKEASGFWVSTWVFEEDRPQLPRNGCNPEPTAPYTVGLLTQLPPNRKKKPLRVSHTRRGIKVGREKRFEP